METRYAVTATRTEKGKNWRSTAQLPTFFLDASVQGILNTEHAIKIAKDIVGDDADVYVCPV